MMRRLLAGLGIAAWTSAATLAATSLRGLLSGVPWLLCWIAMVAGPIVAVILVRRSRPSA